MLLMREAVPPGKPVYILLIIINTTYGTNAIVQWLVFQDKRGFDLNSCPQHQPIAPVMCKNHQLCLKTGCVR